MSGTNFLIGRGEMLTYDIKGPNIVPGKVQVYTLEQARLALAPEARAASEVLDNLPAAACPDDFAVAKLAMNPSYIAKSFFPAALLRSARLTSVGSRSVNLVPRKTGKAGKSPVAASTTELFVAGTRDDLRHLSSSIEEMQPNQSIAVDLTRVERIMPMVGADRLTMGSEPRGEVFEAVVHLMPDGGSSTVQAGFVAWATALGFRVRNDLAVNVGSLWFVPVQGNPVLLNRLSDFTFLRTLRSISRLRSLRPFARTGVAGVACSLPAEPPVSTEPRVAILDGGLPADHPIGPWLRGYRVLDPLAQDDPDGPCHGLAVTSAFLFGPIEPNGRAPRPYSNVDNLRVFDREAAAEEPFEMYRSLGLIEQVLLSRQYEFINLSVGPELPIEDGDVHPWTSLIDDFLSDGATLMTISAGNNGLRDSLAYNDRVQVPADCVNGLAVGAASSPEVLWQRAPYSARGPGRSPGMVKPDVVAFGGAAPLYFHALEPGKTATLAPMQGTSFAAPFLLRSAVGIRALLGTQITPLAIKALLIHAADQNSHALREVGWGRVPHDVLQLISCGPGVARIIYQGELKPGKFLRADLPLPKTELLGRFELSATFCYASPVDPQDAPAYTRAGLSITFRPDRSNVSKEKTSATSRPFFSRKAYATEAFQRSDMGKWETVLHAETRMLGSSLSDPAFDIHYNARAYGGKTTSAPRIRYALVLTVRARRHPYLYSEILNAYQGVLIPIEPLVSVPITT